jgi:hypothetical protein
MRSGACRWLAGTWLAIQSMPLQACSACDECPIAAVHAAGSHSLTALARDAAPARVGHTRCIKSVHPTLNSTKVQLASRSQPHLSYDSYVALCSPARTRICRTIVVDLTPAAHCPPGRAARRVSLEAVPSVCPAGRPAGPGPDRCHASHSRRPRPPGPPL